MSATNDIVEIAPKDLMIKKVSPTSYTSGTLTMKNKSSSYVYFKPLIKHPTYSIKADMDYLKPQSEIKIKFKHVMKQVKDEPKTEKVLFLIFKHDGQINSSEQAKALIKAIKRGTESQQVQVTLTVYEDTNNDEPTNVSEIESRVSLGGEDDLNNQINNYKILIDNQNKEKIKIHGEIDECEKQLENIRKNKELNIQKDKAMKPVENKGDKNKKLTIDMLLAMMLVSFTLGGILSRIINYFCKK